MSPPTQRGDPTRRDGAAPEISATARKHDQGQGNPSGQPAEVIQSATGLAPCGRRTLWLWLVVRCAYCGGSHAHRGGRECGVRLAGCGLGRYYVTARRKGRRAA
ncbi:MAG TPA: hypothetical protein VHH34_25455 [Pseudonocardiaceae bacterium]|nr:hypothetical protein [Pseudonocardiaceae bacterium]